MIVDIEQRIEDLLKHTGVWDETKETLRELLAEHKAGTLDADDARFIEGLHRKMFPGRNAAAQGTREVREVKADNDDAAVPVAPPGASAGEVIAALREDLAGIVTPSDMPEAEQVLRREILAAINAKLDDYDAKRES
jgi:hypothetical protein